MGSPTLILKNVRLLDPELKKPGEPVSVTIADGRIASIDSAGKASGTSKADDEVMDMEGRYALPGLIDCHAHPFLAETNLSRLSEVPPTLMTARAVRILRGMLQRGFTTVRDAAGGDWGIRQAVADGVVEGPRLFISGRALSQTGGHGDFRALTDSDHPCQCAHALAYTSHVADGVDEVRKAVREQLRLGADQIKIMVSGGVSSPHDPLESDQYSPEEIRVIVEEAEKRGTYVMAHAYGASAIRMALECGVRSIEHGNLIDEKAARLAAEKGAYLVPTLVTYKVLGDTAAAAGWSESMLGKLRRVHEAGLDSIRLCRKHGVKIGLGTDLLGDSFDHQSEEFTIRSEVEDPRQIIQSATKVNAEILQHSGRLGTIAEGAYADILIMEQDPFKDLSVLVKNQAEGIRLVMKQGQIYKNTLH